MRMKSGALALSAMAAVLVATPAMAQTMEQNQPMTQPMTPPMQSQTSSTLTIAQADAFDTVTPPLTYTAAEDRRAAVTYLDDSLGMIDWANRQLSTGDVAGARSTIMGASGKLTTAYLLNFHDRDFSTTIMPLTMRFETALNTLETNPQAALNELSTIRNQVASAGQAQLALMGGGAGQGTDSVGGGGGAMAPGVAWEQLNFITVTETMPGGGGGLQDLNIPDPDEID